MRKNDFPLIAICVVPSSYYIVLFFAAASAFSTKPDTKSQIQIT